MPLTIQDLEAEARRKFTDERYTLALKAWLRGELEKAWSVHLPQADVKDTIDRVWKEVME